MEAERKGDGPCCTLIEPPGSARWGSSHDFSLLRSWQSVWRVEVMQTVQADHPIRNSWDAEKVLPVATGTEAKVRFIHDGCSLRRRQALV